MLRLSRCCLRVPGWNQREQQPQREQQGKYLSEGDGFRNLSFITFYLVNSFEIYFSQEQQSAAWFSDEIHRKRRKIPIPLKFYKSGC